MKTYTLDTNIVAYLMKGMHGIGEKLESLLEEGNKIIINPITYYEICRGLISAESTSKLQVFRKICEAFGVSEFSKQAWDKAAAIYADLRAKGELVEDADIFIAAICICNSYVLVTNNEKHFQRIKDLTIENWSSS